MVLFLACIMIQIFILSQYNDYFGTDEYYYQNYIDQFGDRLKDQTDEKLQNENSGSQLYIQNSKPLKTLLLLINYSRNWNAKAAFNDMPTESGNCGKTEDPPFS